VGCKGVTYSDLGERAYGQGFRLLVSIAQCTQQLAICTVYFSFIADNVRAVLHRALGVDINVRVLMVVTLPFMIFLSLLKDLKVLAPFSKWGVVLMSVAVLMVAGVMITDWGLDVPLEDRDDTTRIRWPKAPEALCAVLYSYEGINLILPVESAMARPDAFHGIYYCAMVNVFVVFASMGALSVMAFGIVDDGSITAFLMKEMGQGETLGLVFSYLANLAVSATVVLTYPLQLFPCVLLLSQEKVRRGGGKSNIEKASLLENEIEEVYADEDYALQDAPSKTPPDKLLPAQQTQRDMESPPSNKLEGDSSTRRVLLVLGTFVVAACITDVQKLISLAGAMAGSMTALIVPPLLAIRYPGEEPGAGMRRVKSGVLFLIGVFLAIMGTYASLKDIVMDL